jgi:hypothetical protein
MQEVPCWVASLPRNVTASPKIDRRKYSSLLAKILPADRETEEQYELMLRDIERIIARGKDNLSPEREKLVKPMTALIEDFEEQHY